MLSFILTFSPNECQSKSFEKKNNIIIQVLNFAEVQEQTKSKGNTIFGRKVKNWNYKTKTIALHWTNLIDNRQFFRSSLIIYSNKETARLQFGICICSLSESDWTEDNKATALNLWKMSNVYFHQFRILLTKNETGIP